MKLFKAGDKLRIDDNSEVEIVRYLASGRQGNVYIAKYCGTEYALKWYKPDIVRTPEVLSLRYENLKNSIKLGPPDPSFLWPIAVTEIAYGSFGYIMPLIPDDYIELRSFLTSNLYSAGTFKGAVDFCLRIVFAFRNLHLKGLCYQDINDGNFFVNPYTYDVLICDNDNVAPEHKDLNICGKPKYMAPEIVTKKSRPNTMTDRHSLATIIFRIIFSIHPLEGKRWIGMDMPDKYADEVYGKDPVFVFDPDDKRNAPDKKRQDPVTEWWELMPDYIKELFLKAFSRAALAENPSVRPEEVHWLDALTRFRCNIAQCECGNEVFIKNASSTECDSLLCGNEVIIERKIRLPKYTIPAIEGSTIYKVQIDICDVNETLDPILRIVPKDDDPHKLGLKNISGGPLTAITPFNKENTVGHGESIPLLPGIRITSFDKPIEII